MYNKYYIYKEQVSQDGINWVDTGVVSPSGNPIGTYTTYADCTGCTGSWNYSYGQVTVGCTGDTYNVNVPYTATCSTDYTTTHTGSSATTVTVDCNSGSSRSVTGYNFTVLQEGECNCGTPPPTPTGDTRFTGIYSGGQTYTLSCNSGVAGGDIIRGEITASTAPPYTAMTDAIIGNCCTVIGYNAFMDCYSLTSVTIPNSVHSINSNSFKNCTGLTSVTIPNSVKGTYGLDGSVFINCTSLVSCNIPTGVTFVNTDLFLGCSSLSSITIPAAVTKIGFTPFSGCTSLQSITCLPTTPPTISENMDAFDGTSCPIYVPSGSVSAYQSAYNGKYASRIQAIT